MTRTVSPDPSAADPRLAQLDGSAAAALLVDPSGRVLWANTAGHALTSGQMFGAAALRTIERLAAGGGTGLTRLAFGGGTSLFRSERFAGGELRGLLLRSLSAPTRARLVADEPAEKKAAPAGDAPVELAAAPEPDEQHDIVAEAEAIAALEGAEPIAEKPGSEGAAASTADAASLEDRPPDPREPFDPQSDDAVEPAAVEANDGVSDSPREDTAAVEASSALALLSEDVATTVDDASVARSEDQEPPTSEPANNESAEAAKDSPPLDVRFVFETDSEARLTFLSPDLAEAVGASAASAVGRTWRDLASELDLDSDGIVAAALDGRRGWRGAQITWPTAAGARIPFELSALPTFDSGRLFVGFRGFGVSRRANDLALDAAKRNGAAPAAEAAPVAAPVAEAPAEPDPIAEPDADVATVAELQPSADEQPEAVAEPGPQVEPETPIEAAVEPSEPAVEPDAEPEPEPKTVFAPSPPPERRRLPAIIDWPSIAPPFEHETERAAPQAEPVAIVSAPRAVPTYAANVVPLGRDPATLRPGLAPRSLSDTEVDAFDEIARRLAEAPPLEPIDRDLLDQNSAVTLQRAETTAPELLPAPAAQDLAGVLDRLATATLVLQDDAIVFANRAALELSGHDSLAELAMRRADTLFASPVDRSDAAHASLRLVARDGLEVDVSARASALEWRGAPATLLALRRPEGVTADARENELAAILDTATDGVLTLDGAGRVLSLNRSAEALLGYEAREIVGSLFTLALAPESRRAAFDYLDGLRGDGVAALLNDGREVLGLVRQGGAIPLYMTIGRVGAEGDRFCAVLRDITHWKKVEEELLAARRQADRANAQKSEFLAKVSHEIRTPLNAIIGFAEVMMEERLGAIGNNRYKEYLRDIHMSGGHLISLVNDLLDLSKIESGRLELELVDLDLNEAVAQSAALLQPEANRNHIIIRTSLARHMPPVRADRRSVRQMVINLVSNAVKFTPAGGQVIVATALTDRGEAVIRVRDTGVGMSRKDVALALEPFRPLPQRSGDAGAGIGLPLTKALAEANEAVLAIQSAVGEGTLVEITFPATSVRPNA